MEEKIKVATEAYRKGYTCSQAVFAAYAKELNIDSKTAYSIMEGFGGGIGGMQEVCGAFSAACAVVSFYSSDGEINDGKSKKYTYEKMRNMAESFQKEYNGITCRDILRGETPKAFKCEMKVKDAVLLVEQLKTEIKNESVN